MDLSGWGMEADTGSEQCAVVQIKIPVAYTGRTKPGKDGIYHEHWIQNPILQITERHDPERTGQ